MEVFKAKEYTIIVNNEWLKKAKALLDYELCELIIRCSKKPIVVKCYYKTTPPVSKQNSEEKQLNESNDKSDKKKDQEEQKKTAKLAYTIFISNDKLLDNIKANKEKIIPISLILKEELKEAQKFFENKPLEIKSLVTKQKKTFF
ncbi:hypothetical protein G9A89_001164 [Geosiphon pyriformis]|nr:hypothetical protein G9A89_001164 [Geosiphon pyriformis]